MTFEDTSLTALDGFGKELDSMHIFWLDGAKVRQDFAGRFNEVDYGVLKCRISPEEARDYFAHNLSQVSNKSPELNAKLEALLNLGREYEVEWSEW